MEKDTFGFGYCYGQVNSLNPLYSLVFRGVFDCYNSTYNRNKKERDYNKSK